MILDPAVDRLCFWKEFMDSKCCRFLKGHRKDDHAPHARVGAARRLAAKANPRDTPGIDCGLRLARQPATPTLSHVQLPDLG